MHTAWGFFIGGCMETDRLIDVEEAAMILQTSKDFLYRNWKKLPFARKLSRKQLRFSSSGIDAYLKQPNNEGSTLVDNEKEKG
jgi:predicted DNA-binding transcriptional regulator AlpA